MDKTPLQFHPHWAAQGPHRQTVFGTLLPSRFRPTRTRHHVVQLKDGEHLLVFENGLSQQDRPPCVLVHGLGGSYRSGYMQRIAAKLAAQGQHVFRINLRGSEEGVRCAYRTAHAGCSADLADTLRWVQNFSGHSAAAVAGFSLGGNIVLKLLSELDDHSDLTVSHAIAVAPPIDLDFSCRKIRDRHHGFYDRSFLKSLRRGMRQRKRIYPNCPFVDLNPFPRSLREFDERFTARLNGFKGADDYYQQSSSKWRLNNIRVPTRILYAEDDPVVPAEIFKDACFSTSTSVFQTRYGGHLGYLAATRSLGDHRWLDATIVQWLNG